MTPGRWTRVIRAPRSEVYRALLDPKAVQQWMVPDGMTSEVHSFEARQGGPFRISLTYDAPTDSGKTTAQTDTFHGHFIKLVPDTEIIQRVEFDTGDPGMQGAMTISYLLADSDDGTALTAVHEGLPPGLSAADNDLGWNMSLDKLTRIVEHP